MLFGKHVVNFLLALIELFASCHDCGGTSDYRLKIGVFSLQRAVWPKIWGRPHQSFFLR